MRRIDFKECGWTCHAKLAKLWCSKRIGRIYNCKYILYSEVDPKTNSASGGSLFLATPFYVVILMLQPSVLTNLYGHLDPDHWQEQGSRIQIVLPKNSSIDPREKNVLPLFTYLRELPNKNVKNNLPPILKLTQKRTQPQGAPYFWQHLSMW